MPYKTQNPHLGPGGKAETFNETAWPNDRVQIGYVHEEGIKRWQMFKVVDAAVTAAGDVLYVKNYASYEATPTIGNSSVNEVAGVAEMALVINSYAWLRQGGTMDVKSEASLDGRGDIAFAHTANNSLAGVNAGTAPTNIVVGRALAARDGGTGKTSVYLDIRPL